METVVLTVHLILALLLIGVVLLQRNEGGALLSGGGSTQARGQATGLTKLTWVFAIAFICTSLTLAVMAARDSGGGSVLDSAPAATAPAEGTNAPAAGESLLPPAPADEALTPPAITEPSATEPAAPEAPAEAPATGETTAPATGSN